MANNEFTYAELSLASYANLLFREISPQLLRNAGISGFRADQFSTDWVVVDPLSLQTNGLQAFVLEHISSQKRVLAIRGTEGLLDVYTDAVHVFIDGSFARQPQFLTLQAKVTEWLSKGILPPTFTVTGHSLGGFLAAGIVSKFSQNVEHAYLFNAPGLRSWSGGILGGLSSTLGNALISAEGIDPRKITNIRADAGISPIAGLGANWAPPEMVFIENQLDPILVAANGITAFNHGMVPLNDSMALHSLYQQLDPGLSLASVSSILRRLTDVNSLSLETGVNVLNRLFGDSSRVGLERREDLYAGIQVLQDVADGLNTGNSFRIHVLENLQEILASARLDDGKGLAYRHALKQLNPFALAGPVPAYELPTLAESLSLFNEETGTGVITSQWMRDRTDFLLWKNEKYEKDLPSEGSLRRRDSRAETILYEDRGIPVALVETLSVRVIGGSALQLNDPIRITFGSVSGETITGGKYGDHLYGDLGDDTLSGGQGNDYLEGGAGHDTYIVYTLGELDGTDTILDTDGQGTIILDETILDGGYSLGGSLYRSTEGEILYSFKPDENGRGTLVINDVLQVQSFVNGALGIFLQPGEGSGPDLGVYVYHYEGAAVPVDAPDDSPRFWGGSDLGDEYRAGDHLEDGSFVEGASSGTFLGKGGNDHYLGSHPFGGDYANGGAGDDILEGGVLGADLDVVGEAAADHLFGDAGSDLIIGGQFGDFLYGDFEFAYARGFDGSGSFLSAHAGDGWIEKHLTSADPFVYRRDTTSDDHLEYFDDLTSAFRYAFGIQDESEIAFLYDDIVAGGAGDDWIVGGNGSDALTGDEGNDTIIGDYEVSFYRAAAHGNSLNDSGYGDYLAYLGMPGDDVLDGGAGDDNLSDLSGSDTLYGGPGNDVLIDRDGTPGMEFYPDGKFPLLISEHNHLDGGEGNDEMSSWTFPEAGFSELYGREGDDSIRFEGHSTYVEGNEGDDHVEVIAASAVVHGGDGNDVIQVEARDYAHVQGGAGADLVLANAPWLVIDQSDSDVGDEDQLTLETWHSAEITAERAGEDLILTNQWLGATVVMSDWYASAELRIGLLNLADLSYTTGDIDALIDREWQPTPGDDFLHMVDEWGMMSGGDGNDRMVSREEQVFLMGGAGDDEMAALSGGLVWGGSGNDVMTLEGNGIAAFNRGDGADRLSMASGTITLGGGLSFSDISISTPELDLVLDFGAGDSLTLVDHFREPDLEDDEDYYLPPPLRLQFVSDAGVAMHDLRDPDLALNGVSQSAVGGMLAWQLAHATGTLSSELVQQNLHVLWTPDFESVAQWTPLVAGAAPVLAQALPAQIIDAGDPFAFEIPAGSFSDADNESLSIAVTGSDWSPLPEWLGYDSTSHVLSGSPGAADIGPYEFWVTALDPMGNATSTSFTLTVVEAQPEAADDSGEGAGSAPGVTVVVDEEDDSVAAGSEASGSDGPVAGDVESGTYQDALPEEPGMDEEDSLPPASPDTDETEGTESEQIAEAEAGSEAESLAPAETVEAGADHGQAPDEADGGFVSADDGLSDLPTPELEADAGDAVEGEPLPAVDGIDEEDIEAVLSPPVQEAIGESGNEPPGTGLDAGSTGEFGADHGQAPDEADAGFVSADDGLPDLPTPELEADAGDAVEGEPLPAVDGIDEEDIEEVLSPPVQEAIGESGNEPPGAGLDAGSAVEVGADHGQVPDEADGGFVSVDDELPDLPTPELEADAGDAVEEEPLPAVDGIDEENIEEVLSPPIQEEVDAPDSEGSGVALDTGSVDGQQPEAGVLAGGDQELEPVDADFSNAPGAVKENDGIHAGGDASGDAPAMELEAESPGDVDAVVSPVPEIPVPDEADEVVFEAPGTPLDDAPAHAQPEEAIVSGEATVPETDPVDAAPGVIAGDAHLDSPSLGVEEPVIGEASIAIPEPVGAEDGVVADGGASESGQGAASTPSATDDVSANPATPDDSGTSINHSSGGESTASGGEPQEAASEVQQDASAPIQTETDGAEVVVPEATIVPDHIELSVASADSEPGAGVNSPESTPEVVDQLTVQSPVDDPVSIEDSVVPLLDPGVIIAGPSSREEQAAFSSYVGPGAAPISQSPSSAGMPAPLNSSMSTMDNTKGISAKDSMATPESAEDDLAAGAPDRAGHGNSQEVGDGQSAVSEAMGQLAPLTPPAYAGLTSWDITNALLEFHLGNPGSSGIDEIGIDYAGSGSGKGMAFGAMLAGDLSLDISRSMPALQQFDGLREGFASLGRM